MQQTRKWADVRLLTGSTSVGPHGLVELSKRPGDNLTLMGFELWPGVILLPSIPHLSPGLPNSKLRKLLCGGPNTNVDNLSQDTK